VGPAPSALRQALHLGHNYIGTGHILLGLVDEQDTAATLAGLGVTKPAARQQITAAFAALLAGQNPAGQNPAGSG
jgi:ATP-dependent Clp protease ATP-binding subunit ClpA